MRSVVRIVVVGLLLAVVASALGQSTVTFPCDFGVITVGTTTISYGGGSESIATSIQGGAGNVVGATITATWCRTGYLDMATDTVEPISAASGGTGWTSINTSPVPSTYAVNSGSSYGNGVGFEGGLDSDLFTDIALKYTTGWYQYGQFSLEINETEPSGSHNLIGRVDTILDATSIKYASSQSNDTITQNNTANTVAQIEALQADVNNLGTGINSAATNSANTVAAVNVNTTAVNNLGTTITNQPANTGGFWSSLFVPQASDITELKADMNQFLSWGPFGILNGFITMLGVSSSNLIPYEIYIDLPSSALLGQSVGGPSQSLVFDLRSYEGTIKWARGLGAGALWFFFLIKMSKKIIRYVK